jgi:hypothetical protein
MGSPGITVEDRITFSMPGQTAISRPSERLDQRFSADWTIWVAG